MKRRVLLVNSGALALSPLALAQTAPPVTVPVTVGMLFDTPIPDDRFKAFRDELARLGWREGGNLRVEVRVTDTRAENVDAAIGELLALGPKAMIVGHEGLAVAIRRRSERTAIVMTAGGDPVGAGLAASLQRPGGSVTGLVSMYNDIRPKLFELARQLAPKARRFGGMFFNPSLSGPGLDAVLERGRQLARQQGAEYVPLPVRDAGEIEGLVASLQPAADHVLLVNWDPLMSAHYARIAALARSAKLPSASIGPLAQAGGVLSYGPDFAGNARRVAQIADKVLRGTPPGEIPIEQPTLVKLVLNLGTAKAIGLTIPQSLLVRADEVIE